MSADEIIALVLAVSLDRLPRGGPALPRAALDDHVLLAPVRRARDRPGGHRALPRPLPGLGLRRGRRPRRPGLRSRRAGRLPAHRRRRRAGAALDRPTPPRCSPSALVSVLALFALQRFQGSLPFNPTDVGGVPSALAFNTAVSFVTNTNWQNYAGESTMSHLTQMVGLAVQNFVSAAVGLAVAVALIRGLVRRHADTIGNFWVDLVRGIIAGPAAHRLRRRHRPGQPGGRPEHQRLHRGHDPRGRRPGHPRRARPPARRPSRSSAPTAAATSTPTRPTRFEQPQRLHQPLRDLPAAGDPVLADGDVRAAGRRPAPGPGRARRHVRPVGGQCRPRHGLRDERQPRARRRRCHPGGDRRPVRRQRRGQGGPLRQRRLRPVRRLDHRHLDRRGQLGPRQLHPAAVAPCRWSTSCSARSAPAAWAPASTGCWSSPSWRCSSPGSWSAGPRSTWARRSRPPR